MYRNVVPKSFSRIAFAFPGISKTTLMKPSKNLPKGFYLLEFPRDVRGVPLVQKEDSACRVESKSETSDFVSVAMNKAHRRSLRWLALVVSVILASVSIASLPSVTNL